MFCQNCGQTLSDDAKFCENCGALTPQQPQSPIPQQTTPPPQQGGYQQPVQQGYQPQGMPPQYAYQQPVQQGYQPAGGYPQQQYNLKPPMQKKKSKALPVVGVIAVIAIIAIVAIVIFGGKKDIDKIQLASSVDTSTNLPVKQTTVFAVDTPVIYCTFRSNLKVGTAISTEWTYLGASGDSVTYDYTTEYSPEQNYFFINMPDSGWSVGNYQVTFYIEGKSFTTVKFSVKDSTTSGNTKLSPTPSTKSSQVTPSKTSSQAASTSSSLIQNVQTASAINQTTLEPTTKLSVFSTTAPIIYVTFSVNNAPVGSAIHLEWIYSTTGEQITTWDATTTLATQNAQCGLNIPSSGVWPVGQYEVKISLGGKYVTSAKFTVK